jgi:hypothetical protein
MKRALPLFLLLALSLPRIAHAGDPKDALIPADPADPAKTGKTGEPLGFTLIPLDKVRVVTLKEMMQSGGLVSVESFGDTKRKKKKKKRLALPPDAVAAGLLSAAYEAPRTWGDAPPPTALALDTGAPLSSGMVTRAAAAPEPGSAVLCLLAFPALVGYFRTRSKNA